MNFEKLKYSKCPHCKKYGIKALRGVGYNSNHEQTCLYCKKRYRMNWALSFLLKISILCFYGIMGLIIHTYFSKISTELVVIILTLLAIASFYFIIRICPMEEVKEKK